MFIQASRNDELVSHTSVEKYVKALSDCVHQFKGNCQHNTDHHMLSKSALPRGTIIFHSEDHGGHYTDMASTAYPHIKQVMCMYMYTSVCVS